MRYKRLSIALILLLAIVLTLEIFQPIIGRASGAVNMWQSAVPPQNRIHTAYEVPKPGASFLLSQITKKTRQKMLRHFDGPTVYHRNF